jgi:uncharacterized radical SAM superfamily Fe-S cluster-containing enzyme
MHSASWSQSFKTERGQEIASSFHVLAETLSLCPVCFKRIPASLVTDDERVYITKECPLHGKHVALVSSSLSQYQEALKLSRSPNLPAKRGTSHNRGCPYDCGLCPDHNQHTCLAIVEVTQRCNLTCPVCIASSPSNLPELSQDQLKTMLKKLTEHEGKPTPIQFSGGEPTLRKDLAQMVQVAVDLGFKLIEIDTNGIQLAKDPKLARELADSGLSGVYLQFDGVTDHAYETIRGTGLFRIKEKAVDNARKAGLSIVFATTVVRGVNDSQLWDIIKYALERKVGGVNFQTFAASGRYPKNLFDPIHRTTISDVKSLLSTQSKGRVVPEDFSSIPSLKNCAELGYFSVTGNEITSINRLTDPRLIAGHYDTLSSFDEIETAAENTCCACNKLPEIGEACCPSTAVKDRFAGQHLSLGIHSPQDAWTADIQRWEKCCVQELMPSGALIPFCLQKMTNVEGKTLY